MPAPVALPRNLVPQPAETLAKAPERKPETRPRIATSEVKPAQRPVPLPPRRVRTAVAVASVQAPVPAPPTPFGSLPALDRVAQVIAALPAPPMIQHVEPAELLTTRSDPLPVAEPVAQLPPPRTDVPAETASVQIPDAAAISPGPAVEPVRVTVAANETAAMTPQDLPPPAARRFDASWPPPIDVIGAILANSGSAEQK